MPDTLWSQIGAGLMVVVCGFGFWKGDEPERVVAGAYLLGWFSALLIHDNGDLYNVNLAISAIDTIMLLVLVGLAWRFRRVWLVWAAACQLLVLTSYVMTFIDLRPSVAVYFTVINMAGYGVLLALAIGTFWAWQERRAAGLE